ncbi:emp24/gp25L/p24 family/GOLD-domain-containing protein [Syncephalis pseudoplumigaleata]|uniref:Emp24/gp25L/p24 family/GOLD-domain-containing protein n=1 Tax=Syncephalis pseudoplumigaleata TaxID=1712513 RepID=A0A4P9Z4Y7_9FUNG|nr:emp24/gp25L/p24 family/GOLD-domain-containing protein [Syncephalis pseudoplumigaleata]|eukprot:RKP26921.1 emp24/gp25L/p24 family/GOLD-domain-containing protein [Syncephalis pseudoplumigaleata]
MLSRSIAWLVVGLAVATPLTSAFHFYLDGSSPKCFIEELPKETLVVGNYRAEEYRADLQQYAENHNIGIQITVEEKDSYKLVNQKGASNGRFAFTSAESGDHTICLQTNATDGWFSTSHVRLTLDMLVGQNGVDPTERKDAKLSDLYWKVRELNNRIQDIKREQEYQREREVAFRNQSELTNSRVVWWTIMQMLVLGGTCVWQMRHLKQFFVAKKLV